MPPLFKIPDYATDFTYTKQLVGLQLLESRRFLKVQDLCLSSIYPKYKILTILYYKDIYDTKTTKVSIYLYITGTCDLVLTFYFQL